MKKIYSFISEITSETKILFSIILLAAILRIINLTTTPPGFNQDEACYTWNAYCLLKTGHDQMGIPRPVFYTRGLGGNCPTLFFYILLLFEAAGGMNIWTARFASAAIGIISIILFYILGKRLFGPPVGLVCSALLAITPWHIHLSRFCHDGSICPFYVILVLVILSQANLLSDSENQPRPVPATIGGLAAGISCYGYNAMRIFWPFFLLALLIATAGRLFKYMRSKNGLMAILGFILGFTLTFGPLAYMHITAPNGIGQHGKAQLLIYAENMSKTQILKEVIYRYAIHFSPAYLFMRQNPDKDEVFYGYFFQWYMFPLVIAGLAVLIPKVKNSISARLLLVWFLIYPVSDSLGYFILPHMLRSSPGLCSFVLLSSLGAVYTFKWIWNKNKNLSFFTIAVMFFCVLLTNIVYMNDYFCNYGKRIPVYHNYHVDVKEACRWLSPRLKDYDAVFWTTNYMNMPYINTLVHLHYEPSQWFKDEHLFYTSGEWDYHVRYGRMNFMYGNYWFIRYKELKENNTKERVLFIVRPGEFGSSDKPLYKIYGPDGKPLLLFCEYYI